MILQVTDARVVGPHAIELSFNDGTTGVAEVTPLLIGPVFEPLRDPAYFASMELDSVCGTVTWPNGADVAPEALLNLIETGPVV